MTECYNKECYLHSQDEPFCVVERKCVWIYLKEFQLLAEIEKET